MQSLLSDFISNNISMFIVFNQCHRLSLKRITICLLSSFSELQYRVAEGALAPEAKDIAVNRK